MKEVYFRARGGCVEMNEVSMLRANASLLRHVERSLHGMAEHEEALGDDHRRDPAGTRQIDEMG